MRKLLFLVILFPVQLFAQYNYTFQDLSGKWIEQTRTDKKFSVIPFKDTLFIEVRETGFMMVRHTIGPTSYGDAELKEDRISIEKESFTIVSLDNDILKLKQGNITHRFLRFKEFTDSPVSYLAEEKEGDPIQTGFEKLKGKWYVYKKTDPEFDRKRFYIKKFEIKAQTKPGAYIGEATFHNMDSVYTKDVKVNVHDRDLNIIYFERAFNTHILKSDGGELELEHAGTKYYLKKD